MTTLVERMKSNVAVSDTNGITIEGTFVGCWEWQRSLDKGGYGKVSVDGKTLATHRVMFALFRGECEKGLVLDHLCSNRKCCNPVHLDPVTQRENVKRGKSPVAKYIK